MAPDRTQQDTSVVPAPPIERADSPVYAIDELGRELRQCEIISNLRQYTYNPVDGTADETIHPFAIVLSQDCDLLLDFDRRSEQKPSDVNAVLLYELEPAADMRSKVPPGRDIWKRMIQNNDERYHFLEAAPTSQDLAGAGFPEVVIDFKRCFTVPPLEVYRQCGIPGSDGAHRRCRLTVPYREHLQNRAAFYLLRVSLPLPHSQMPTAPKMLPPGTGA